MSSEYSWNSVATKNIQPRAVENNRISRDKKEEIRLDQTHSTKKSKRNLPQRITMEPMKKKITDASKPSVGALFWRNVGSPLQN
jgi:hypothetical protein